MGREPVPGPSQLSRHLRSLRPAAPPRGVRPLHLSRRGRPPAHGANRHGRVACPTSNLFLGSGLFDFDKADAAGMPVALATDVGGGTSFSMLQTMNEAHKVARLTGHHLTATRMFWLATRARPKALDLDDKIGTLAPAVEADFVVLDPAGTPLLARRTARAGIARRIAVRVRAARRRSRGVRDLCGRQARASAGRAQDVGAGTRRLSPRSIRLE